MILTIVAVLILLWLLGIVIHVGAFIHILLIAAVVIFIYDHTIGRRSRV
jgi:hypothetical protein